MRSALKIMKYAFLLIIFQNAYNSIVSGEYPETRVIPAMGTYWQIVVDQPITEDVKSTDQLNEAAREISRLEKLWSPVNPDSEIASFKTKYDQWISVSPETFHVLEVGQRVWELTDESFDPTLAPVIKLWRFEPDATPPDPNLVKEALKKVGFQQVNLRTSPTPQVFLKLGVELNLSGIAKGYAAEIVCNLLSKSFKRVSVSAGGDVVVKTHPTAKPMEVSIRDPGDFSKSLLTLQIRSNAVMTSGTTEKFFIHDGKKYHHILNPHTGFPVAGVVSVTVIGPDAAQADALATGLLVLGHEKGIELINKLRDWECLFVTDDGKQIPSKGFKQFCKE